MLGVSLGLVGERRVKRKFDVRLGLLQLEYLAVYDTGAILRYWLQCTDDKITATEKYEIMTRRNSLQTMLGRYIEKRRLMKFRQLGKLYGRDQLPAQIGPLYRPLLTLSFVKNKQRKLWSGAQLMYLAAEDLADPHHPCKYDLRGIGVLHQYIRDYLAQHDVARLIPANDATVLPLKVPPPSLDVCDAAAPRTAPPRADDDAAREVERTAGAADKAAAVPSEAGAADNAPRAEAGAADNAPRAEAGAASEAPAAGPSSAAASQPRGCGLWSAPLFRRFRRRPGSAGRHRPLRLTWRRGLVTVTAALVVVTAFNGAHNDTWGRRVRTWWQLPFGAMPRPINDQDFDALDELSLYVWRESRRASNSLEALYEIAKPLTDCRWLSDQSRARLILCHAALMRGRFEDALAEAEKVAPMFPRMQTPMPNNQRLLFLYRANAYLNTDRLAAAQRALAHARQTEGAYKHTAMMDHLESYLLYLDGRPDVAVTVLRRGLRSAEGEVAAGMCNTLSLFLALEGDLTESAAVRLEARLILREMPNDFETARNLLSEALWTLKRRASDLQPEILEAHARRLGLATEWRLLAPHCYPNTQGDHDEPNPGYEREPLP